MLRMMSAGLFQRWCLAWKHWFPMSLVCSFCKVSHHLLLHPTCALLDAPIWAMFGAVTASGQILLHFHSIYLWEAHRGVTGLPAPAKLREPESSWSTSPFTSSTLTALPAAWNVWGCVVSGLPVGILLRRCCVVLSWQLPLKKLCCFKAESERLVSTEQWVWGKHESWTVGHVILQGRKNTQQDT